MENYVHDIVHQLSEKVDSLWRYDEYITNAKNGKCASCVTVWKKLKETDREMCRLLQKEVERLIKEKKFTI